jgi:hypothetical protein
LPPGVPPQPHEQALNGANWAPFTDQVQFELTDIVYQHAQLSASNIDDILGLWAQSLSSSDVSAPFKNHNEMHATIISSVLGDVPWECLQNKLSNDEAAPSWMQTTYEVWYCNPDAVISMMLSNPEFEGQFDLHPHINLDAKGTH